MSNFFLRHSGAAKTGRIFLTAQAFCLIRNRLPVGIAPDVNGVAAWCDGLFIFHPSAFILSPPPEVKP